MDWREPQNWLDVQFLLAWLFPSESTRARVTYQIIARHPEVDRLQLFQGPKEEVKIKFENMAMSYTSKIISFNMLHAWSFFAYHKS